MQINKIHKIFTKMLNLKDKAQNMYKSPVLTKKISSISVKYV